MHWEFSWWILNSGDYRDKLKDAIHFLGFWRIYKYGNIVLKNFKITKSQ